MADEEELDATESSEQPADALSQDAFSSGGESGTPEAPAPQQPGAETPAQDVQALTIRDLASRLGYAFGEGITDDYTALAHLAARAREADRLEAAQRQQDVYTQLGRQLAPKAEQLGQFLRQEQQPRGPKPYEPPPFDERWAALVERDAATGLYVGKPGTQQEIVAAANKYAEWTQGFLRNPAQVIQPLVEERATAIAEAKVAEAMARYSQQQTVMGIARQNADWFYAKDQDGQFSYNPTTGQHVVSQLGLEYLATVRQLGEYGIVDPSARDQVARSILAGRMASQEAQEPNPAQHQAQQRQGQALRQGSGSTRRNPLQSLPANERRERRNVTEPDNQGLSMGEIMAHEFEAAGITDADFRAPGAFTNG